MEFSCFLIIFSFRKVIISLSQSVFRICVIFSAVFYHSFCTCLILMSPNRGLHCGLSLLLIAKHCLLTADFSLSLSFNSLKFIASLLVWSKHKTTIFRYFLQLTVLYFYHLDFFSFVGKNSSLYTFK